ncbi:arrestin-related trafficking adapter [Trichoderma arundinaceum]|uniref:Arrestin-related trafficking adapter n=1 Tax=Trichoderma arundinaceum TaxID=490622 RepID=A0A395NTF1_TRIAR|nr:arrestin-related trafficking adapter [Trichoderma arundinaceum]
MPAGAAVQPPSSRTHRREPHRSNSLTVAESQQTDDNMTASRESDSRHRRRRRRDDWVRTSSGNILYRPDAPVADASAAAAVPAAAAAAEDSADPVQRFPTPPIGPRRTRPHSIHVVSYPSGYVPRELRARTSSSTGTGTSHGTPRASSRLTAAAPTSRNDLPVRLALTRLFQSLASNSLSSVDIPQHNAFPVGVQTFPATEHRSESRTRHGSRANHHRSHHSHHSHEPASSSSRKNREPKPAPSPAKDRNPAHKRERRDHRDQREQPRDRAPRQQHRARSRSSRSRHRHRGNSHSRSRHVSRHAGQQQTNRPRRSSQHRRYPPNSMTTTRGGVVPLSTYHLGHHNSFSSIRSSKSSVNAMVTEVTKPVATGSGVACSILLAEPNLFLSGFDHNGHERREARAGTALLRGRMQLTISKNVKIKAVQLKLVGRARTEWPEGIPPLKQDLYEEESLRTQVLTFFNALNEGWETEYGNQCTYKLKGGSANSSSTVLTSSPGISPSSSMRNNLTSKELKRLSLQNVQSRSFGKGESGVVTPTQAKGFKVFYPGVYDYSFELPIDHHQLETTKLQYASVKWELHATVDRAGAFKPNLHGVKEVPIIRLPDQMSLEMSEPISISRQWEDQLHYDIMVSGKSFPIGAKIPIAFKLTPLAKVQVHKLKVYITESVEYWTNDKRVTRKDPGRKILLLEKTAGKELDSAWSTSELVTLRGGELTEEQRRVARETATRRRAHDAARRRQAPEPLPAPVDNLLGDLDLGLENMWGSTEIEASVQIPTCEMMAKNKSLRLHPDCSWKNVNVFHWIKVVMRISRLDTDDPSGTKRRHFEISIDSPLTILNCRATRANTFLPAYSGEMNRPSPYQSACGCPDSPTIAMETSPSSSTGTLPDPEGLADSMPAPPQAAHLHSGAPSGGAGAAGRQSPTTWSPERQGRPIHLLRAPSFNPPAFDDDTAPPPAGTVVYGAADIPHVMTPPPQYDAVVGTPSVDGLADYFTRLAEYGLGDGHEGSGSDGDESPPRILDRSGRVNVAHPRTPGGRRMPSRSMEIPRPPMDLNISALLQRSVPVREEAQV